ncbi:MAG: protein phosphatase 2C domain-containing protein [Actinomycetota bacterium]
MICASCGEDNPDDAKWCEACGHDLLSVLSPPCVACGEREVGPDGYCLSCGHKQPAERDHQEYREGTVVAVSDRGRRHRQNEDAVAIATTAGGVAVLVVCDGVSTTAGSARASLRAAAAARDLLVAGIDAADEAGADVTADLPELLTRAVAAAQVEASASVDDQELVSTSVLATTGPAPTDHGGPPSSTFVAVVATPDDGDVELATAWVGDSRAYWLGEDMRRLTPVDHELQGSLIRWLGADSVDPTPDIETVRMSGPGRLVVCSDGLWRYAAEPRELDEVVRRLMEDGRTGLDLASGLVDFANDAGGHDNITVALWSNSPDWAPGAGDGDGDDEADEAGNEAAAVVGDEADEAGDENEETADDGG